MVAMKKVFLWSLVMFLAASPTMTFQLGPVDTRTTWSTAQALDRLEHVVSEYFDNNLRVRRDETAAKGVTNLDIRDAILQLLNVIRDGSKTVERHDRTTKESLTQLLNEVKQSAEAGSANRNLDKKIDNISTFLLRMNAKLEQISRGRMVAPGRGSPQGTTAAMTSGSTPSGALETLAQESYDILTLIPTYIENTRNAITELSKDTKAEFQKVEKLLVLEESVDTGSSKNLTLAEVTKMSETKILGASKELKEIMIESGHMAESLFERINDGYSELGKDIKGLAKVEKVLIDTAESVMDTKKKIEFGVQQIIFKIGELVKMSGGKVNDEKLKDQFEDIARTILENQSAALGNLSTKVEKELGQVWRQMGIMYGQVSSSINILEKVKEQTEGYVNNTGKNLGAMEGQVEGLTDRMVDVDQNLNYMLGQLSLVVQEFNQVKTGLGEAISGLGTELNEIREYKPPAASGSDGNGQESQSPSDN